MTQTQVKFTRADYLAGKCTHRQYYGQFVNPEILGRVKNWIGLNAIKTALAANDEHLNTIGLAKWDSFVTSKQLFNVSAKMKEAGDFLTLAGGVCIAKEAAKQLAETNQ
jgi:hypothetical protein